MVALIPIISGLIEDLETIVKRGGVDVMKTELQRGANELDSGTFQNLHVPESIFGGLPRGQALGQHHSRAHTVMSETIEGVISDLRAFRDGVVQAERMLDEADEGSAADLTVRQAAVEALEDVTTTFEGDQRYHEARNNQGGGDR